MKRLECVTGKQSQTNKDLPLSCSFHSKESESIKYLTLSESESKETRSQASIMKVHFSRVKRNEEPNFVEWLPLHESTRSLAALESESTRDLASLVSEDRRAGILAIQIRTTS